MRLHLILAIPIVTIGAVGNYDSEKVDASFCK